jgi:nitroreductase
MNVYEALQQRKSVRAFLDKPVSKEQITRILDGARHSPSGANHQPWQVSVVGGKKKAELSKKLVDAFYERGQTEMDYHYYPTEWPEPYKRRRVECGAQLYGALNIERKDKQRRIEQWIANYRGFDAPVILFFFLNAKLATGSFMDCGMFLQSVMLAAVEEGLATCPQAALGQYPDIIKNCLGYEQELVLLCGMALGYEDTEAPINSYRTPRAEVETFTKFLL